MKKLLSLALAVAMVLGMTTLAFAAPMEAKDRDTTVEHYAVIDVKKLTAATTYTIGTSTSDAQSVDGANFDLPDKSLQYDDGGDPYFEMAILYYGDKTNEFHPITKGSSTDKKLSLGATLRKNSGSSAIEKINTTYKEIDDLGKIFVVRFYLVDTLVSVKDVDYKATIQLTSDGRRVTGSEIVLEGNLENQIMEDMDSDFDGDIVSIEDGPKFEITEYLKSLTIEVDEDLSIVGRFFAKDYYLNYSQEPGDADAEIMAKYDIDTFYELKSVNFGSNQQAKFNYADNMYVYSLDAEGALVYVGRSKDALPFYSKYFVSVKELELETAEVEEPVPTEDGDDVDNAEGGGDYAEAPSEANNYNPGTGR